MVPTHQLRVDDQETTGRLIDLSVRGAFIEYKENISEGERVRIRFDIFGQVISTQAVVLLNKLAKSLACSMP